MSTNAEFPQNGWAAVPRSFKSSLADVDKNKQAELSVRNANPPDSDIANKTHEFVKQQLPGKTYNHSMRVWYYGKWRSLVLKLGVRLYERSLRASTLPVESAFA